MHIKHILMLISRKQIESHTMIEFPFTFHSIGEKCKFLFISIRNFLLFLWESFKWLRFEERTEEMFSNIVCLSFCTSFCITHFYSPMKILLIMFQKDEWVTHGISSQKHPKRLHTECQVWSVVITVPSCCVMGQECEAVRCQQQQHAATVPTLWARAGLLLPGRCSPLSLVSSPAVPSQLW